MIPQVKLTVAARATEFAVCQQFKRLLRAFKEVEDGRRMTAAVPRMRLGFSNEGYTRTRRAGAIELNARLRQKDTREKKRWTDRARANEHMSRSYIERTFKTAEKLENKLESQRPHQSDASSAKMESVIMQKVMRLGGMPKFINLLSSPGRETRYITALTLARLREIHMTSEHFFAFGALSDPQLSTASYDDNGNPRIEVTALVKTFSKA